MSEDSCPEENFTLPNAVQVGIQLQTFDLRGKGVMFSHTAEEAGIYGALSELYSDLTMSTQACFPSMKPLGMAFGVRISYLEEK